eukprot:TRINITY_DN21508_c0_g1_i1.p1 TRINITY_DN21508_c0_g1~~TRINITY_DN21508_c0_g1_i1.p1  ORF type:complete len:428 (+),score=39.52 TRINITY_DN21508_c0_g1_i1:50-1333(+)
MSYLLRLLANFALIYFIRGRAFRSAESFASSSATEVQVLPVVLQDLAPRTATSALSSVRRFRTSAASLAWRKASWNAAPVGGGAPAIKLGKPMGPFTGGHRTLRRYAGRNFKLDEARSFLIEKDEGTYSALFNEQTKTSDVVYYVVDSVNFEAGNGRGTAWAASKDLKGALGKEDAIIDPSSAYKGVGNFQIDRGHQTPAASFNAGKAKVQSTNLAENLTPQSAWLNKGNWKHLEQNERDYARESGLKLDVLTGPLYELPDDAVRVSSSRWAELFELWCNRETRTKQKYAFIDCKGLKNGNRTRGPERLRDVEIRLRTEKVGDGIQVPLGYFKVVVSVEQKAVVGIIMDQTGEWWLMAGLPGVDELAGKHSMGFKPLDMTDAVKLPPDFDEYDANTSSALAERLLRRLVHRSRRSSDSHSEGRDEPE